MSKTYFIFIVVLFLFFTVLNCNIVKAEDVCFTEGQAVDIITLLDASERDIELLESCKELVDNLYREVEERDKKIINLTDEIINANQKVIRYRSKYKTVKRIAWYTSILSGVLVLIQIAPLL